jgi:MATE family multidrug resistance protein
MLLLQFWLILGLAVGPLLSWWGFVATLIANAVLYGWRVLGGYWRHPDRLARALAE